MNVNEAGERVRGMERSLSLYLNKKDGDETKPRYLELATKKAKELDAAIAAGEISLADVYGIIDSLGA